MRLINCPPDPTCLGRGDVHRSKGNGIEGSKMKHSSEDVDRWLYHVRADVAREGQGDDVLFNNIWERCMNTNGCFHFSSSLCLRVLMWVCTVWGLRWSKKTDESRYDVCPVLLLPLHHQASTARVMMMRAARTGAYYFTIVKDNGPASYCAEESVQASNYCFSGPSQHDPKNTPLFPTFSETEDAIIRRRRVTREAINLH